MLHHHQISVVARQSPLSRVQAKEVELALQKTYPHITFTVQWLESTGDKDKKTSLRDLGKTDFFTKELDDHLLNDQSQIAVHSAKDLPDPLTAGLAVIAITEGIDSSDVLVLQPGKSLMSLPNGAKIATSSHHRENNVRLLRNDFEFVDIRGLIGERLEKLTQGEVDGVVIAKAALIRLGLHELNEVILPGATTPLQGKLAVVARHNDLEMKELFACIDSRNLQ